MLKIILPKMAMFTCALTVAFTPIGALTTNDQENSLWKESNIFADPGTNEAKILAKSNKDKKSKDRDKKDKDREKKGKDREKKGPKTEPLTHGNARNGLQGAQGIQGEPGAPGAPGIQGEPGAGFTIALVPEGQSNAGSPVTSLTFEFETNMTVINHETELKAYVTTPDGRTIIGETSFTGVKGSGTRVTITKGPFFVGQYTVGIIVPASIETLEGVVFVGITEINGEATSSNLGIAGIVIGSPLPQTNVFYNAQYPFFLVP